MTGNVYAANPAELHANVQGVPNREMIRRRHHARCPTQSTRNVRPDTSHIIHERWRLPC